MIDSVNDRLVFLMTKASQDYWEELWHPLLTVEGIAHGDLFVTQETKRVLPPGARVIDAGCGIAATVHGLSRAGFQAYGIDYAEKTINAIRTLHPQLKVDVADVRAMPFDDCSIDGVWSLGVIEHFFDGFDALIAESYRVLRPGGYLFLTVPVISPLKSLKIRMKQYPEFDPAKRDLFFQFAFRKNYVVSKITAQGFVLERSCGRSGSFGLTEDLPALASFLLLDERGRSFLTRVWWRLVDMALTPFSHHTRYFRFRRLA